MTWALVGIGALFLLRTPPLPARRLRIAGYEEDVSWFTGESLRTDQGTVPSITCPVGKYRPTSVQDTNYARVVGIRREGCRDCPRGRYGDAEGLTSEVCSAKCPLGTYRETPGATSQADCKVSPFLHA